MAHVASKGQTITFCGVNAHFQNGKAERTICTLHDLSQTQLLHTMAKWPNAITTHLWPYAITNVTNILNDTLNKNKERTRIELFANNTVQPNIRHHHHIGIPVYVLNDELQYLGKSPRHARNVSLVLNPCTGMTSAQYHVKFDDAFETVNNLKEESHGWWLQKCGFKNINKQQKQIFTNNYTTVNPTKNIQQVENRSEIEEIQHYNVQQDQSNMEFTIDPFEIHSTKSLQHINRRNITRLRWRKH
jgi:hypothetical protein